MVISVNLSVGLVRDTQGDLEDHHQARKHLFLLEDSALSIDSGNLLEYAVMSIQDAQVCSMANTSSLYVTVLA